MELIPKDFGLLKRPGKYQLSASNFGLIFSKQKFTCRIWKLKLLEVKVMTIVRRKYYTCVIRCVT